MLVVYLFYPHSKIKTILLWEQIRWFQTLNFGLLRQKCPISNCEITEDRTKYNVSDLVLIHMWDKIDRPPTYRPPNQRWVFLMYESPIRTRKNLSVWNNLFNMTSTYMIDSDFPGFYESEANFFWKENKTFNKNFNFYGNKTKFAAAVSILIKVLIKKISLRSIRSIRFIKNLKK